jgi:hypothetical protein
VLLMFFFLYVSGFCNSSAQNWQSVILSAILVLAGMESRIVVVMKAHNCESGSYSWV